MNKVPQRPLLAFAVALGAVAVLSLMDAVMKQAILIVGTYSVLLWRAQASALMGAAIYLPGREGWPTRRVTPRRTGRARPARPSPSDDRPRRPS